MFFVCAAEFFEEHTWTGVLSGILFLLSFSLFIKVVVSDPGFLTNNNNFVPMEKVLQINPIRSTFFQAKFVLNTKRGRLQKLKYCRTCVILRPARVSHCNVCGYCVEKYDHHCPWLGNCIGKKNYKDFLCFLTSTTTLILFDFSVCIKVIYDDSVTHSFSSAIQGFGGIFFILLYTFTVMFIKVFCFLISLIGFHCFLIKNNTTTHEFFVNSWKKPNYNPYKLSLLKHLKSICWLRKSSWVSVVQTHSQPEIAPEILIVSGSLEEKSNSLNTTALNKQ